MKYLLTTLLLAALPAMAQVKISELPTASSVADADKTIIVQGGVTKQATAAMVRSGTTASQISDSTTVGRALLKLTNPSAITFLRINADNTVTALSQADMRTALGLGTAATSNSTAFEPAGVSAADITDSTVTGCHPCRKPQPQIRRPTGDSSVDRLVRRF